jgi:hypothetical protein
LGARKASLFSVSALVMDGLCQADLAPAPWTGVAASHLICRKVCESLDRKAVLFTKVACGHR